MQLWRRYLTNTKISFVENDAKCVQKHKTEIEKVAQGKVYVGEPTEQQCFCPSCASMDQFESTLPNRMMQATRQTLLC